jgi:murein DD-endopeptidase MepM/ murein hydrolase activator NlpD
MQVIITDAGFAKSRAIHLNGAKLAIAIAGSAFVIMLLAAALYHWVFLKGAREGWPVIGTLVRLVVKDDVAQQDRFMRENIDLMAKRMGEMQAKMLQIESLGERVSGLAGLNPADMKAKPGEGGFSVSGRALSMEELQKTLDDLEQLTQQRTDVLTVIESRLFEQKIKKMMVPTQVPVQSATLGSTFGWRIDPFTGRSALHTGLDFPAEPGTSIFAAAGGVVVTQEFHPQYGNMIEIDHGNDLITRYAHSSRVYVKKGDLIKRGQKIAEVGTTGRSTGPHLHFEVLVQGVPQDPQKFLTAGANIPANQLAQNKSTGAPMVAGGQTGLVRPAIAAAVNPVLPASSGSLQR